MPNNIANPFILSANLGGPNPTVRNPTTSTTVTSTDDIIICGDNSLAITLNSTSNSPVYISSVDGTNQRTGCTIVVGSQDWVIADSGAAALCIRYGPASANLWCIIGAKTAS